LAERRVRTTEQEVVDVIRRYGATHPAVYGDVRWETDHYVVSFTGDLEEHRRQLRALIDEPQMVEVASAAYSGAYLMAVSEAVRARYRGDPRRILKQSGPGSITLRAPFVGIAAELHGRYGDALDITVGNKPYPPARITPGEPKPLPGATIDLPELRLDFELGEATVPGGDDLVGAVVVTNRGNRRLRFMTGPTMTAGVRRRGDAYLAGGFSGWMTLAGRVLDLPPGQRETLRLIVGTTSCLPDLTYVVPPGAYQVVASFGVNFLDESSQPTGHRLVVRAGPDLAVTVPSV
jgi:hypothetical protein